MLALSAATVAATQPVPKQQDVRLLFAGDILLSREVEIEVKHRGLTPWVNLQELFHAAQWVGGNLEGAVGPESDCIGVRSPCFAIPESEIELLKRAGFSAVTNENNHAGDLGSHGRKRTKETLQRAGLQAIVFENSPQYFQLGTTRIALLALTTIAAADGRVQQVPSSEVRERLRSARANANLVMVSIHWGHEMVPWPSQEQRRQAAWLVANGADLVLGHHPHVIQAPECIAGRPVFFSLGNHVFDQADPRTKKGLIADCHISRGRLRCGEIRTHANPGTSEPLLGGAGTKVNSKIEACAAVLKRRAEP